MVARFTDTFQVEWKNREDSGLTWLYDPMHFPRPLLPLTGEFLDRIVLGDLRIQGEICGGLDRLARERAHLSRSTNHTDFDHGPDTSQRELEGRLEGLQVGFDGTTWRSGVE